MKQVLWIRALAVVGVVALAVTGCGGGEGGAGSARDEEFAAIEEQKTALGAKRAEVADLEAQIVAAAEAAEGAESEGEEGESEEGEVSGPSVEELEAQLTQAQGEAEAMGEEFMNSIVMFLNNADMVQGEAPTGTTLTAIRLKTGEDMVIAEEYVKRGGDYRRALDILETAEMLDPDNPDLHAAKARYDELQYMTEERFETVSKGMSEADVQARLGTVNPHNVRTYEDKDVTAWFYRRADKGAAAVYFQEKDGAMVVYRADYNAVKPDEEPGDAAG